MLLLLCYTERYQLLHHCVLVCLKRFLLFGYLKELKRYIKFTLAEKGYKVSESIVFLNLNCLSQLLLLSGEEHVWRDVHCYYCWFFLASFSKNGLSNLCKT